MSGPPARPAVPGPTSAPMPVVMTGPLRPGLLPPHIFMGQARRSEDRPCKNASWLLVGPATFRWAGCGDLSTSDLRSCAATLPAGWAMLAGPRGEADPPCPPLTLAEAAGRATFAVLGGQVYVVAAPHQPVNRLGAVWRSPGYGASNGGGLRRTAAIRYLALRSDQLLTRLACLHVAGVELTDPRRFSPASDRGPWGPESEAVNWLLRHVEGLDDAAWSRLDAAWLQGQARRFQQPGPTVREHAWQRHWAGVAEAHLLGEYEELLRHLPRLPWWGHDGYLAVVEAVCATILAGHLDTERCPSFTRNEYDILLAPWRAAVEHDARSQLALAMLQEWPALVFDAWPAIDAAISQPEATP